MTHLASHILGQMARRIAGDWERTYGHPIYYLETFVDPERHRGTCYRAANWVLMGRTTGRGKNCPNKRPNRSIKEVGIHSRRAFGSCWRRDKMKAAKETVEVNLPELEALLERKREALGEEDYQKLKKGLWALSYLTVLIGDKDATISQLRALLMKPSTEKTRKVLEQAGLPTSPPSSSPPRARVPARARRRNLDTAGTVRRCIEAQSGSKSRMHP